MNQVILNFNSCLENEAFARISTIAFLAPLNPTSEEIMEIKTIISEAVTNSILHGYDSDPSKMIQLQIGYDFNRYVTMIISDTGNGIEDIAIAMEPLYTTKAELERSGMGMTIMQTFSDSFDVTSCLKEGTTVVIKKQLRPLE